MYNSVPEVYNNLPVDSALLTPLLVASEERTGSTSASTRMPVARSELL